MMYRAVICDSNNKGEEMETYKSRVLYNIETKLVLFELGRLLQV